MPPLHTSSWGLHESYLLLRKQVIPSSDTVGWEAQDRDRLLSSGNLDMFATTFEANFFYLFLCWARYVMGIYKEWLTVVVLNLLVTTPCRVLSKTMAEQIFIVQFTTVAKYS